MSEDRITLSELARRLDVSLPVVSNWRRRHTSFPAAETGPGQDVFLVADLAAWLDDRKIAQHARKPGEPSGTTYGARFRGPEAQRERMVLDDVHRLLDRVREVAPVDDRTLSDFMLALLDTAERDEHAWNAVRRVSSGGIEAIEAALAHVPYPTGLRHARTFLDDPRRATALADLVAGVHHVHELGLTTRVFEDLLSDFARRDRGWVAGMLTPPAIVDLLVELAATQTASTIFDPCCEFGEFLVAAEARRPPGSTVLYAARALSPHSASLAGMNLRMHGVPIEVTADASRILRDSEALATTGRFDVVLTNPPFGLRWSNDPKSSLQGPYGSVPPTRTEFAWLQFAAASLAEDGRAGIVMPGGTLSREGSERDVRAAMVHDGIVEAIVSLPAGLFPHTNIPVTLWLLHRARQRRQAPILLVDARGLGVAVSRTQHTLSPEDHRRIARTVGQWRNEQDYVPEPGFSVPVPIETIRENDYVLTPARYVGAPGVTATASRSVREIHDDLHELTARAADADVRADLLLERIRAWDF
ncbi:MAG TPA: N-6 DNA methylase [Actinophytocola sp.]|jgi:type I restriction enzyme M protein|nr:N-6 DNA methylase [Actinophytocola sp.]